MPVITAAIIAGGASLAGGAISAASANKSQKSAYANQQKAFANAQSGLDEIAGGDLEAMFGSRLDPEAFLYHPVDITQSQLDTISGNLQAFPSALELTNKVNPEIWKNDLSRIRTLMPGYDDSRDIFLGATKRLLSGQLPFQDVEDIVSNRSGISSMLGTPGGGRNATLRDLGVSRLSAIDKGGSMFQQFIQMAQAISPVESQMRPQQMFFTPQERLQADILQRSLEQQGNASAAMAEAMPDPGANAIANAQIGLNMASIGGSYQPSSGAGGMALGQAVAGAGGLFGSIYGMNRGQGAQPSFNAPGALFGGAGGGGGYAGNTPYGNASAYYPSSGAAGGIATVGNGVGYNYQGMSSFIPTAAAVSSGGGIGGNQNYSPYPSYQGTSYFPNQGFVGSALGQYGQGWYK